MNTIVSPQNTPKSTHNRRNFTLFIAITGLVVAVSVFFALDSLDRKLIHLENSVVKNKTELLSLKDLTKTEFGKEWPFVGEASNTNHVPSNNTSSGLAINKNQELADSTFNGQKDKPADSPALADTVLRKDTLIIIPQTTTVKSLLSDGFSEDGKPVKVLTSRTEVVSLLSDWSNYTNRLEVQYTKLEGQNVRLEGQNQALLSKVKRYEQEIAALRDGHRELPLKGMKSSNK